MENFLPVIKNTQLFSGIAENEISAMMGCLGAKMESYKKGDFVFRQGDYISDITLLLDGQLHIQRDDYWGNCNIISIIEVGEMFGEAYIAPDSGAVLNNVVAAANSVVMFIDAKRIISVCSSACEFHSKVVRNLFYAISEKNKRLVQKLGHISNRTTREKLMSYLSDESSRQNSNSFTIPFNRQQLADFLSVDRSAMSNELCKMRDEGLIEFERSRFKLI